MNVTVAVETPLAVTTLDTLAVTPAGAPLTVIVGVATKPPPPVTVTALVVEPPCRALPLVDPNATEIVLLGATGSSSPQA